MNKLNKLEEQLLFHTLGYDYEPRWNDNRGGYRNWFGTTSNSVDYPVIQTLIEKGYMKKDGNSPWGNNEYETGLLLNAVEDLVLRNKE